jgi:hypothetical protein
VLLRKGRNGEKRGGVLEKEKEKEKEKRKRKNGRE